MRLQLASLACLLLLINSLVAPPSPNRPCEDIVGCIHCDNPAICDACDQQNFFVDPPNAQGGCDC